MADHNLNYRSPERSAWLFVNNLPCSQGKTELETKFLYLNKILTLVPPACAELRSFRVKIIPLSVKDLR
jgi:hypothetical protein